MKSQKLQTLKTKVTEENVEEQLQFVFTDATTGKYLN